MKKIRKKSVLLQAFRHIIKDSTKSIKIFLFIAVIFSFLSTSLWLITPIIFKIIIDKISQSTFNILIYLLFAYACSRILMSIFENCKTIFLSKFVVFCSEQFSVKAFANLIYQSSEFHSNRKTGEVIKILDRGLTAISDIFNHLTISMIPAILQTIALFIYLIFKCKSISYSLLIIIIILLYSAYTFIVTEYRRNILIRLKDAQNNMNQISLDALINYENVKIYNNEKIEIKKYSHFVYKYCKEYLVDKNLFCILNIGQNIIMSCGIIIAMFFSIKDVRNNVFTIGDFVLINTYLLQIYMPLSYLGVLYREIKNSIFDIEKMLEYFFIKNTNNIYTSHKIDQIIPNNIHSVDDNIRNKNFIVTNGEVEFKNVSFSYHSIDIGKKCINNISFHIKPNKINAIIGKTGSGKSTLLKLILQFYYPTDGEILIDGQNIAIFNEHIVREYISIVSQDVTLFNDTIRANILYASQESSNEDLYNICKIVNLDKMINKLPNKYDTIVGERGLKLSGGERQRVSIARALMKKSKIFIFDEATSSLDSKTELMIHNEISQICKNVTLIVVAHRLSTIQNADQIIVLDDGEIAEIGNSHLELLQKKGIYYKMWDTQHNKKK